MPENDEMITVLDEPVSLEYTAAIQYNQHSMLLTGRVLSSESSSKRFQALI